MKTKIFSLLAAVILAACSAPKYTYNFDYHDYNAGRKAKQAAREVATNPGPVAIQPEMLVAEAPVLATTTTTAAVLATTPEGSQVQSVSKYNPLTMSKAEKKEMIQKIKSAVKEVKKSKKSGDVVQTGKESKAMDRDLKLALIFLIIAIVGGVLYGISPTITYIITTAALIAAIVFFVKWLMRQ